MFLLKQLSLFCLSKQQCPIIKLLQPLVLRVLFILPILQDPVKWDVHCTGMSISPSTGALHLDIPTVILWEYKPKQQKSCRIQMGDKLSMLGAFSKKKVHGVFENGSYQLALPSPLSLLPYWHITVSSTHGAS